MPQPDAGDVYVNQPLTQMSIAYRNPEYIADMALPPVGVELQTGIIPKYGRGDWLRSQAVVRAPGTRARRSGYSVDLTATYRTLNYALGKELPREVTVNTQAPFDAERDGTEFVTEQILLAKEVDFAATIFASGNWTTTSTGGTNFTKWSDYADSDPIGDIRDQMRVVQGIIGRRPNTAICGQIVWDVLQDHPDFLDRIKGAASPGQPAIVQRRHLAQILELDRFEVASAIQVTSVEGASTETRAFIVDDDLVLMYLPPRASLLLPTAAHSLYWRPMVGNGPHYIRSYEENAENQEVVEAHTHIDFNITSGDAGMMFVDAVD